MMTFDGIADELLKACGYNVKRCGSEKEAIEMSEALKEGSVLYPVYYSLSDTSGEKPFEEFVTDTETADTDRFASLGVITGKQIPDREKIMKLSSDLNSAFSLNADKNEIIRIMKAYLPNFEHIETGRSLDNKM